MTEEEFRRTFRHTPVSRAKYRGFLRNVAIAMGNSQREELLAPLRKLSEHPDQMVADTAQIAHGRLLNALETR